MEIKNLNQKKMGKEEEGTKAGKEEKSGKEKRAGVSTQFRVVISEEANQQLEMYLRQASEGDEPVVISKSDLANYVFCNLSRFLSDSDLKILRSQHFDERSVLKGLLKKMKQEADLPQELKRALRDYYGISDRDKKRPSRSNQPAVTEQQT